jgi:ribosomal protein L37AE/L43A
MKCPKCKTENNYYSKRNTVWVCRKCGIEFKKTNEVV